MKHSQKAIANSKQKAINEFVLEEWEKAKKEIDHHYGVRLRSCQAFVYESENYYFLRSYNTTVAFIDKKQKPVLTFFVMFMVILLLRHSIYQNFGMIILHIHGTM